MVVFLLLSRTTVCLGLRGKTFPLLSLRGRKSMQKGWAGSSKGLLPLHYFASVISHSSPNLFRQLRFAGGNQDLHCLYLRFASLTPSDLIAGPGTSLPSGTTETTVNVDGWQTHWAGRSITRFRGAGHPLHHPPDRPLPTRH